LKELSYEWDTHKAPLLDDIRDKEDLKLKVSIILHDDNMLILIDF